MEMELVKVDTDSLRENIIEVEKNVKGEVYLIMNNQTMRCLESMDVNNFENIIDYSNGEEAYITQYDRCRIMINNNLKFGIVEIR